jgi:hypothetical protein
LPVIIAGPAKIARLRKEAVLMNLDPNIWFPLSKNVIFKHDFSIHSGVFLRQYIKSLLDFHELFLGQLLKLHPEMGDLVRMILLCCRPVSCLNLF